MKIINPYTEILTPLDGQAILRHIELCGRVCYKSEDKITDTSAAKFVAGIIKRGHEAVLEHFDGKPYPIKEQVARIGNSVVPIMAKALVQANCPHLIKEAMTA